MNEYLSRTEDYLPSASPEMKVTLNSYVQSVKDGFLVDLARQKGVAKKMKFLMIIFQVAGFGIAIGVFSFYPITRQHAEETRRKLNERKAADAAE